MKSLLKELNLEDFNPGACSGPGKWVSDPNGKELVSYNPTTGEAIARIVQATSATYEQVAGDAHRAFLAWRDVPAPRRGLVVRDLGEALRLKKDSTRSPV